jgi:hypothetical protein
VTIVIAQRRGEEILILSDTMIRESDKTRDNVFPGRLKAVIIGPQVTVAFAGNADPALLAVQGARRELRRSGLSTAIDILKHESQDGGTDFLIAIHDPTARLVRLRNGVLLEAPSVYVP